MPSQAPPELKMTGDCAEPSIRIVPLTVIRTRGVALASATFEPAQTVNVSPIGTVTAPFTSIAPHHAPETFPPFTTVTGIPESAGGPESGSGPVSIGPTSGSKNPESAAFVPESAIATPLSAFGLSEGVVPSPQPTTTTMNPETRILREAFRIGGEH